MFLNPSVCGNRLLTNVSGTIALLSRNLKSREQCMAFVSMTILVWDHMITFDDEVEYVWNGSNGPVKYLFLLNRYLTPLGFVINLTAYLLPAFSEPYEKCKHFVRFEGMMTIIGINVVALMMFYRVYVLYGNMSQKSGKRVTILLGIVLCVEIALNLYLVTRGVPVRHLLGVTPGCEMIFDETVHRALASSSAWLPLIYDTLVLCLILWRTMPQFEHNTLFSFSRCHRQLLEDGLLYYVPILLVTLVLSLMITFAEDGSQNLMAHITVTMMSRISINLKKNIRGGQDIDSELASMPSPARVAAAHVASVLNITRSTIQDAREDDIELTPRSSNPHSFDHSEFSLETSSEHWHKHSVV
ncbi:hypothetical protein D9756_004628 [Leucocoprinus leucothites]|uniref:DUF6533 domain-containing protein n=1 Tax=Leucocoprinus leucothites TaxID=201217 RepID=A0A8H5G9V5_9AGAR|nr:hypothetical protein D9756_004628 [Leucoagaricus leucothites]